MDIMAKHAKPDERGVRIAAVSYTHLDVYKRQTCAYFFTIMAMTSVPPLEAPT